MARCALLAGMAFVACVAGRAHAEPRAYRGPHPIDRMGHWHDDGAVHVHDALPVGLEPFADVDGVLVFLADPVAFGWDGAVWTYEGAHPLPARIGEYCGITERHRHPFAPEGAFVERDGVWRFAGALRGGIPTHLPGVMEPADGPIAPVPEPVPVAAVPYGLWLFPAVPVARPHRHGSRRIFDRAPPPRAVPERPRAPDSQPRGRVLPRRDPERARR